MRSFVVRGTVCIYKRESSRNAYCRGRQHLLGLIEKDESSALFKHIVDNHPESERDNDSYRYKVNVTGKFKIALTCQLAEAVKIEETDHS